MVETVVEIVILVRVEGIGSIEKDDDKDYDSNRGNDDSYSFDFLEDS